MKKFLFLATMVLLAGGCAASIKIENANVSALVDKTEKADKVEMLIEPYESLGLKETEAIKKGEVSVFRGIFPDILFGEYYPGRIRWNVWAIEPNGREYFGQALFSGVEYTGFFSWHILVDGKVSDEARCLVLSSAVDYGYDLSGREFPIENRKGFLENKEEERKKFILQNGTRLGDIRRFSFDDIKGVISKWNKFDTPKGGLLSPISEDDLKFVASINPQYSFGEKLVASGHFSISLDPMANAMRLAIDIFRATGVPAIGWDYNSQLPQRRQMGLIIKYALDIKQKLIERRINGKKSASSSSR